MKPGQRYSLLQNYTLQNSSLPPFQDAGDGKQHPWPVNVEQSQLFFGNSLLFEIQIWGETHKKDLEEKRLHRSKLIFIEQTLQK